MACRDKINKDQDKNPTLKLGRESIKYYEKIAPIKITTLDHPKRTYCNFEVVNQMDIQWNIQFWDTITKAEMRPWKFKDNVPKNTVLIIFLDPMSLNTNLLSKSIDKVTFSPFFFQYGIIKQFLRSKK